MTKDQMKAVIRPSVRAYMERQGVVSAQVSKQQSSSGEESFSLQTTTGTVPPDLEEVEKMTEMLASVLRDVLPSLFIQVEVTTTTGVEGKGSGRIL